MKNEVFILDQDRFRDANIVLTNLLRTDQSSPDSGCVFVVSVEHGDGSVDRIPLSPNQPLENVLDTIRIATEFCELDLGSVTIGQFDLPTALQMGVVDESFE